MTYFDSFLPDKYYHVFNHAVGDENLFRSHDNYLYFLSRYDKYLSPVFKTYCYCLMPNHFHLLIQVRDEQIIRSLAKIQNDIEFDCHKFVMQKMSNFLNSYAKAFNKQHQRKGSLFIDYTRRKEIDSEHYFSRLVNYIHQNPVHHRFCNEVDEWIYSSYHSIIAAHKKSKLERDSIFDWFGGVEHFIKFHKQNLDFDEQIKLEN